jgi:hypothetical protein
VPDASASNSIEQLMRFNLMLGLLSMNPEIIAEAQLPGWVEAVLNQLDTLHAFG